MDRDPAASPADRRLIGRCYITDLLAAGGTAALLDLVERAPSLGVDAIQVREKWMSARDLSRLVEAVMARSPLPVLVNSRLDVALSCGAAGLHLPSGCVSPARLRPLTPEGFLIGTSCHTVEEVRRAEEEGADYALLAPIFSKEAMGLRPVHEAAHSVAIPVLALGGVTLENESACLRAGARGIAGIGCFQGLPTFQRSRL